MKLLEKGQENDMKVSWEDQNNINKFSKFTLRLDKLLLTIENRKQEYEYLQDLETELELLDDELIKYKIGDCFVSLSVEKVQERLEQDTLKIKTALDRDDDEILELKEEMAKLKAVLYGKFGSSINLEK